MEYWYDECWSAGVMEKNKGWSDGVMDAGVLECWSNGVLESEDFRFRMGAIESELIKRIPRCSASGLNKNAF